MLIQLMNPEGRPNPSERNYAPRPARLEGLTIGLLSNRKANAEKLLLETARRFVDRHRCVALPVETKDDASRPAAPEMLRSIALRSDFLLTAAGD